VTDAAGSSVRSTASLPMYDLAEIRPSVQVLWETIAGRLAVDPAIFGWPEDVETSWSDPGLVLGQACGLPLQERLGRGVGVVGTFTYVGAGDASARYAAVVVARDKRPLATFAGCAAAVSNWGSLSGWASLGAAAAAIAPGQPFFGDTLITGSHAASLEAVRTGRADVASIDAVTHALIRTHRPDAVAGTTVIGVAPLVPCLPLITAMDDVDRVRSAVQAAVRDPAAAAACRHLLITGFTPLTFEDYAPVLHLRDAAAHTIPRPASSLEASLMRGVRSDGEGWRPHG
jgi:hypothetical protein